MNAWITEFINQFGYFAIALLIALENVFPPLPSEIILTMSGFMTTTTSLSIIGVVIAATIGSLIGALILYALGRQLTVNRLKRLLGHRLFKLLGFHQDDAKKAEAKEITMPTSVDRIKNTERNPIVSIANTKCEVNVSVSQYTNFR